ncbi:MAG: class I adenylate-forming enzyme family protein [Dehalococcoidales bacterium]
MKKMNQTETSLYSLDNGEAVTSLSSFPSPQEEYLAAFEDRAALFLEYYAVEGKSLKRRTLTRGEFLALAETGAAYLIEQGVVKGDRVVHCFSGNSPYDLVFRLAGVLAGCVPVTVNWQADDNQRIAWKARETGARMVLYDRGFTDRIDEIKAGLEKTTFFAAENIETYRPAGKVDYPPLSYEDEKMIIFTSGTTNEPKGVSLPHRSFLANRFTYEWHFEVNADTSVGLLLVNPLHHANSTAFSDWAMRRPGTVVYLLQRYGTVYWKALVEAAGRGDDCLVAPMVSRHIEFLESLADSGELPVAEEKIKEALSRTEMMIGSAPVGPTTVKRVRRFSNRLPNVRFGSTETCLQVAATPMGMPAEVLMRAFEAGWSHRYNGESLVGYYIGRGHPPFTRIRAVRSLDPENKGYYQTCDTGEPGYFVTQGANIMDAYIGDDEATAEVFREGWYNGLRDIVFALKNERDGELDYYWVTRDSALLIRGGANYAYDQVAAELSTVLTDDFKLNPGQFKLVVVGLRVESEHEDSCCVTIELSGEAAAGQAELEADFKPRAWQKVAKGYRPDFVRFAGIPLNFKGAVLYPQLKQDYREWLKSQGTPSLG